MHGRGLRGIFTRGDRRQAPFTCERVVSARRGGRAVDLRVVPIAHGVEQAHGARLGDEPFDARAIEFHFTAPAPRRSVSRWWANANCSDVPSAASTSPSAARPRALL